MYELEALSDIFLHIIAITYSSLISSHNPFLSTFLTDPGMIILRCSLVPRWPCISCISFPWKQMPNDARNAVLNRIELITLAENDDVWLLMWDL